MSNLYRLTSGDTILARSISEVGVLSLVGMFGERSKQAMADYFTEWSGMMVTIDDIEPAFAMLREEGLIKEHEGSRSGYVLTRAGRRLVVRYVQMFMHVVDRDTGIIEPVRKPRFGSFSEINPDQEWVDTLVRQLSRDGKTQRERDEEKAQRERDKEKDRD